MNLTPDSGAISIDLTKPANFLRNLHPWLYQDCNSHRQMNGNSKNTRP